MRHNRANKALVHDMVEACDHILNYTSGMTYEEFRIDTKTVDAVMRRFTILGEAASQVMKEFRDEFLEIPWRNASDLRNILVHFYHGASTEVVWNTAKDILPDLRKKLENVLKAGR